METYPLPVSRPCPLLCANLKHIQRVLSRLGGRYTYTMYSSSKFGHSESRTLPLFKGLTTTWVHDREVLVPHTYTIFQWSTFLYFLLVLFDLIQVAVLLQSDIQSKTMQSRSNGILQLMQCIYRKVGLADLLGHCATYISPVWRRNCTKITKPKRSLHSMRWSSSHPTTSCHHVLSIVVGDKSWNAFSWISQEFLFFFSVN